MLLDLSLSFPISFSSLNFYSSFCSCGYVGFGFDCIICFLVNLFASENFEFDSGNDEVMTFRETCKKILGKEERWLKLSAIVRRNRILNSCWLSVFFNYVTFCRFTHLGYF
ncbi:hypothetical protein NE237_001895 [Protea cynaroides]|uniref:Uncharacterized protein n=1 Tax=Protea cynaroides TaxID=273540 RepID=A0A9Q0KUE3_9MAGN|nr:hypothetical protein NE237_001895 [Protea cynaroides]